MSLVMNPYSDHQAQLGVLELGLKSLKTSKQLMCDNEFSDMYWAIESHHRDLRLAHLTGKAQDLMEQAVKDTKFYSILIDMLCEVKRLPRKKQRESLKKVHNWYIGNKHTLQTGPRFGKEKAKMDTTDMLKGAMTISKSRNSSAKHTIQSGSSQTRNQSNKENKSKNRKGTSDFQQYIKDTRDDESTPRAEFLDDKQPPSEPAYSRLEMSGIDFLTSRFLSDIHEVNMESQIGKSPFETIHTPDWGMPDIEPHRINDSALGRPSYSVDFLGSHLSQLDGDLPGDRDRDSVASGDSDGNVSSQADVGSVDMMDFSTDTRRKLSRGQTPSASFRGRRVSEGQTTSTGVYGLPKRMIHSIASLVNPHAKLAENEATRAEQEYKLRESSSVNTLNRKQISSKANAIVNGHVPVLRAVSVTGGRGDNIHAFHDFNKDRLYGQDILSKLSFVGRSGTALDVRYMAHDQGEMPENHTNEVIRLYSLYDKPLYPEHHEDARTLVWPSVCHLVLDTSSMCIEPVNDKENNMHSQPLEDFYQTADSYYPTHQPKYQGSPIRAKSAPFPRKKSEKVTRTPSATKTAPATEKQSSARTQKPLGKVIVENRDEQTKKRDEDSSDESPERAGSVVRLDTVVNMIDTVKDEMNLFREKLAPAPMLGFKQPSCTRVPTKQMSRPGSVKTRARSPSPQQRPCTPTEADDLMMGEAEVPADTYRPMSLPARPHSATLNRAVDWRGKITPQSARNKVSKTRFGGHTYMQKSKTSLRTVGAVMGKRPKTAPISIKERWNTGEKVAKKTAAVLPKIIAQKYRSITSVPYPYYPVKNAVKKAQTLVTVPEVENDKNVRIPQAASNTVTQVDDGDFDNMMKVRHLVGSSGDSRYGSLGSLFMDDEFMRYYNSHHASQSKEAMPPASKEYLSFIGTLPTTPLPESRSQSRQALRKPEAAIEQIPEESTYREEPPDDQIDQTPTDDIQEEPTPTADSDNQEPCVTESAPLSDTDADRNTEVATPKSESVRFVEEPVEVINDDPTGEVRIEVTAISAARRPVTAPSGKVAPLQKLSKSEPWHYQPDVELQNVDSNFYLKADDKDGSNISIRDGQSTKSIVESPDRHCFECSPDRMTSAVGRSAGKMPGSGRSHAGQVLRMSRRQNDYFKKAPPMRTPPSIPSPHHPLGGRSPRQGNAFSTELEHSARKQKSPRHFMEQDGIKRGRPGLVVDLRRESCRSAPPGGRQTEEEDVTASLYVTSLRLPGRSHTAPLGDTAQQSTEAGSALQAGAEGQREENLSISLDGTTMGIKKVNFKVVPASQSLAHIGRPIAQVSHVADPDEVAEAVVKQKQAKAAVDIQRIFRGYVCRNSYNQLLWDNRKLAEDKQLTQVENQRMDPYFSRFHKTIQCWYSKEPSRSFRKHQERKARIYSRPPLDPSLLQWAHDFKAIQTENSEKRQGKMDSLAKEMVSNQLKQKSKIDVIGPHVEIYDIYHPKETGPSKREMHLAAVMIQKHIRGMLVRTRFEKLRRKAHFCGSTWTKAVKDYKNLLIRVQRWRGVNTPKTPFSLKEMYEYMDVRRKYESQFDKKSFGDELEVADLEAFFRECDLYPSQAEIDEGIDVVLQGKSIKKGHGLTKEQTMNLVFYIYVPSATGLKDTRQSTWMNPIIDGVEAKALIGADFVEAAPLKPCVDIVAKSVRERREKEEAEKQKAVKKEEPEQDSSDEDTKKQAKKKLKKRGSKKSISLRPKR